MQLESSGRLANMQDVGINASKKYSKLKEENHSSETVLGHLDVGECSFHATLYFNHVNNSAILLYFEESQEIW